MPHGRDGRARCLEPATGRQLDVHRVAGARLHCRTDVVGAGDRLVDRQRHAHGPSHLGHFLERAAGLLHELEVVKAQRLDCGDRLADRPPAVRVDAQGRPGSDRLPDGGDAFGVVREAHLHLEAREAIANPRRRAAGDLFRRPTRKGQVHRDRLSPGLAHRPAIAARLEVEPRHLLGRPCLWWRAVWRSRGARLQSRGRLLQRNAVIGLEGRGLAVSHGAVVVLEAQQEQLAGGHHPARRHEGLAKRDRQAGERASHESSTPAERSSE